MSNPIPQFLGFDVYGTLIDLDPLEDALRPLVGELAPRFAEVWRAKQLEYSFRRSVMHRYLDFTICTRQALAFTATVLHFPLSESQSEGLIAAYQSLPAFPDSRPGLESLRAAGHRLWAFSNGLESKTRPLLEHAGLLDCLEGVISVDDCRLFKPAPATYEHFARMVVGSQPADGRVWLVSSNSFDVLGAKAAGLRAAWVRRGPGKHLDPWEMSPDVTVSALGELVDALRGLDSQPAA